MQTLLVTVDSLRADHLGQYGYERDTMPVLDRLTDDGTLFENTFANAPYTRISIPAFQTSRHLAYGAIDEFPTIASILSGEGVETAVVGTQTGIGLVDGGFKFDETIDLGRDEFHEEANRNRPIAEQIKYEIDRPATRISQLLQRYGSDRLYDVIKKPYNVVFGDSGFRYLGYTSAERVTDRALSWLESNADTDFFLWVHYMEAHRPYGVHDDDPTYLDSQVDRERIKQLMKTAGRSPEDVPEADRELMLDLYDSDIRYCSRHLERLFDGLEELDLWSGCNVLFSSDHGEEFREHGRFFHRNYPYDELIHVPLLVKSPAFDADDRIADRRELLDLAPTISSFYGLDPNDHGFEGRHLFEGDSRRVLSLGQPADADPAVAVRTDEWKYITNDSDEQLYHLVDDPAEQDDVADEYGDVVDRLRSSISERLLARAVNAPREPEGEVDREQLEALGYMELRD